MAVKHDLFQIDVPPFETADLRKNLSAFLDREFDAGKKGPSLKVGNYKWGVYAFYDYDREPIYIGQTNEKLRTRIRRHLTNQRTDAVAMSVLDPFEVFEVEVWPLPEFEGQNRVDRKAKAHLDALEYCVYNEALKKSKFKAVLNEKDPPPSRAPVNKPESLRGRIVSDEVHQIRSHPDLRIARRALTIARLAQVISERKVQGGLRRVLLTQAQRLQWLAEQRYEGLGGKSSVQIEQSDHEEDSDESDG